MPWFLIGVVIILGFYHWWREYTSKSGAPFVETPPAVVQRIVNMAQIDSKDVVFDLGSGDGRILIASAMKGAKAIGVEKDKLRVLYSKLWIKLLRFDNQIKIIQKDLFKTDLSKATVVCCYLLPETHKKLEKKFKKELKKGTKIVAVAFKLPSMKPEKVDPCGVVYGPLYLYKV